MLKEVIALLLSLFSLVSNENTENDRWLPYINEEYDNVDISEELTTASLYPGYNRIRRSSPEQKSHIDKYQHGILSVSSYGFYHYIT